MSYTFKPNCHYRMPTHFGPSLGPRQGIDGRRYSNIETSRDVTADATFKADPAQLESLLPPGFVLREPHTININYSYAKDVEWLAGRGYNLFGVSIPATYQGERDTIDGDLLLVLWENRADPIITGREDLGYAKLYCELPEPERINDQVTCRASWDGHEFASLTLTGLKTVSPEELPEGHASEGTLHYKYIPKTGSPGEADAAYATLTPADWPNVVIDQAMATRAAECHFKTSTWEQLPTLVHVVNTLASLKLGECVSASLTHSHGAKDLSDQRVLK
ncbi:acetoacetate decarboxylase family protein [Porticoccaceae bacterium]|nr:acetoacetate decarboxylase family protein [Porticoccaceae bacterium]